MDAEAEQKFRHEIGIRIRALRASAGLTQAALAEKAKLSTLGYQRIERGEVDVKVGSLYHIAAVLQVHPSALLGAAANESSDRDEAMAERLERAVSRFEAVSAAAQSPVDSAVPAEVDHLVKLVLAAKSPALIKRLVEQSTSFIESQSKRVQQKKKRA